MAVIKPVPKVIVRIQRKNAFSVCTWPFARQRVCTVDDNEKDTEAETSLDHMSAL